MELTQKEKTILFVALNNLQQQGLINTARLITSAKETTTSFESTVNDWIGQGVEEYDIINVLKTKLGVWKK